MDWRNRNYYLVQISSDARHMRDEILKMTSNSVEFHSPYGHFSPGKYDGLYHKVTGISCPSYMLSCKTSDSEILEFELREAERRDIRSRFFKLSKEILGQ